MIFALKSKSFCKCLTHFTKSYMSIQILHLNYFWITNNDTYNASEMSKSLWICMIISNLALISIQVLIRLKIAVNTIFIYFIGHTRLVRNIH